MDEDRLSPQLGRLIDEAKGAAKALGVGAPGVEGVALLSDEGEIYTGAALASASCTAAHLAVEAAEEAGVDEILAAAVATPFDATDTTAMSVAAYERLAGLDPELPVVIKQHGRWVMLAVDRLTPSS